MEMYVLRVRFVAFAIVILSAQWLCIYASETNKFCIMCCVLYTAVRISHLYSFVIISGG